jgi:hypothetical protein
VDVTIIFRQRRYRSTSTDARNRGAKLELGLPMIGLKRNTVMLVDHSPEWDTVAGGCCEAVRERIAAGDSVEQAAPYCKDPTRLPDPSTMRRWAQRRLLSLWCWIKAGAQGERFLRAPTILAWDLGTVCRILPIEARSP